MVKESTGVRQRTSTDLSTSSSVNRVVDEPPRKKKTWADLSTRLLAAAVMIAGVLTTVWTGHIAVSMLVVLLEVVVYGEIVNLGYLEAQERGMPWFKTITWGFFVSTQYFAYAKSVLGHFEAQVRSSRPKN